jgi:hypothetical protein
MSKFKDRLWKDLMREHGAELAQLSGPEAARSRRARPRVLAGTSLGLAGIGAALALVLSAAGSSPAFAVTKNRDGTVSVTIRKLDGIRGANAKLAQIGVHAVAVPVVAGCQVGPPPPDSMPGGNAPAALRKALAATRAGVTTRISPDQIPAGKTLVLAAKPGVAGKVQVARLRAMAAAPPTCFSWVGGGAIKCGPGPGPGQPGGFGPPGTSTATTETGRTPPPKATATTTGTTTAPPTNTATTTTGTTGTGPVTAPAPPGPKFLGCPPPPCAVGAIAAPLGKGPASLAKMRAALANARAALAKERSVHSSKR